MLIVTWYPDFTEWEASREVGEQDRIVWAKRAALETLARLPLLHYNPGEPRYLDWAAWFRLQGVNYLPEDSMYVFDNYQFTVQAALQGEGIVLGFSVLVESLLSNGVLIQVGPRIHNADAKIFIEFDSNRLNQATRDKIFDWPSLEAHHKLQANVCLG